MHDTTAKPTKAGKGKWIIATAAVIGFLLLLGYGLQSQLTPLIGAPAPDFTLSLFGGGELPLTDLRGQVIVVNFWASWCIPCRDEAPALEKVWREYKDRGVVFVGVNVDDATSKAQEFISEFGLTYPNGPDPYNRISKAYRTTGVPETFFIASDGQVAGQHVGPISEAQLRAALEEVLQP